MMAVSSILILSTSSELRNGIQRLFFDGDSFLPPSLLILPALGLLYALYFGLTTGPLTSKSREALLFFAVVVNLLSGIAAGVRMISESNGWLLVFPIWNLANCVILLVIFFTFAEDERFHREAIQDLRANRFVIVLCYGLVLLAFVICHKHFELHWTATLSVCVTVSANFSTVLEYFFFSHSK